MVPYNFFSYNKLYLISIFQIEPLKSVLQCDYIFFGQNLAIHLLSISHGNTLNLASDTTLNDCMFSFYIDGHTLIWHLIQHRMIACSG